MKRQRHFTRLRAALRDCSGYGIRYTESGLDADEWRTYLAGPR